MRTRGEIKMATVLQEHVRKPDHEIKTETHRSESGKTSFDRERIKV